MQIIVENARIHADPTVVDNTPQATRIAARGMGCGLPRLQGWNAHTRPEWGVDPTGLARVGKSGASGKVAAAKTAEGQPGALCSHL